MNKILLPLLLCVSLPLFAQESSALDDAAKAYFDGRPQEALAQYIEISKQSKDKDAFLNAVFIALEQGSAKQAVDIASAGYMLHPQDPDMTEFTAEAYLADGQYENAEKFFSLLEGGGERSEFLLIHLARAQLGMGEQELAKNNLVRAAAGKSHSSLSNYLLGQIYEKEGTWGKAVQAFDKAVKYDHQFTEARAHYANALEKDKQYNDAYRQYRILHSASPKNGIYSAALTRLKPKLTKKEKELEPRKEKQLHTIVKPVVSLDGTLKQIRIGLGASAGGRPSQRDNIVFIPSHAFRITRSSDGKTIALGKAKEVWKAELSKGQAALYSPTGKRYPFSHAVTITPKPPSSQEGATVLIKKVMSGAGMTWASVDDKEYRGALEIIHDKKRGTLLPVNIVNMEEYLMGVMSSEMPAQFPMNALRAQAVLARTYAMKHLGKHKAYGYDVCDTQNCQVYGGVNAESETGNAAVESTMGQVLLYNKKPIEGVFSANCGGFTQSAKEAGWYSTPYLNPVSDYKDFDFNTLQPYHFKNLLQHPHDAFSRYTKHVSRAAYRWARVVEEEDLRQIIKRQKKDIGPITAIIPQKRGRSGYVSKILVKGERGTVTLSKENVIRNNLAPGMLRSSYFIVVPNFEDRKLKNFVFYGGGWGHGVGFCQTGAAGRAEGGQDYKEILEHYFPDTDLTDTRKE